MSDPFIGRVHAILILAHNDYTLGFRVSRRGLPADPADGRQPWRYTVTVRKAGETSRILARGTDLSTGPGVAGQPRPGPREALETLLAFAEDDAERYEHRMRHPDHNVDGYAVAASSDDAEYLYGVADEIGMTRIELEEGASL